ncbi:cationic amino acid transporter 4, vacuolar-like isoform X1 [Abrus precatorius]|uniref:Cationic amino acid transporter 4, vacuolar-like isoform X1 n=1 Tax=Abrus precatorius TaxID=3816 RepID=A0A8B8KYQ3_ABRPR|nr:cationic amino acid transporter 4, vacuolar-like isoform X1 [Abrus precatorius]
MMVVNDGNCGVGFKGRGETWLRGFGSLIRRKRVDSVHVRRDAQLARKLSFVDLVGIGVGSTIGAGVYILIGTVAREQAGPALVISLLIAGIAAGLSAFCYAELACRCPSAGSAYHYTYICIGEGAAWLVGWSLILEYTIGASAVSRGITPNLALFFGGENNLPLILARHTLPDLGIVVDPCAAALILLVTLLLCLGIKESSTAQSIVTTVNVGVMLFIIFVGGYLGFKSGWVGYELPSGYFPYGVNGIFAGSAIVFFSYIGFDSVTSTAEEVKNPQRDLPIGISTALSICCMLYMLVAAVIVGLVPYYKLDPDTPISSAFSSYGMEWAVYIITTGAVTALFASLLGSVLPQPRVFMAMARDGLLPPFFSNIHKRTQIPLKSTIVTGVFAATLAFFLDVSQLAGMVSVGTLLAFTAVAVSVLIIRYVPPDEVPIPCSLLTSVDPLLRHSGGDIGEDRAISPVNPASYCENNHLHEALLGHPLIIKEVTKDEQNERDRRKLATRTIALLCMGILIVTSAASAEWCPRTLRFTLCGVGGILLICSVIVLACIKQDETRHSFGHSGGFVCPLVPFLPAACILINTYLLIDLGFATWLRVSVWLLIGVLVYLFYGRTHSSLLHAIYVPSAYADEIYRSQAFHLA